MIIDIPIIIGIINSALEYLKNVQYTSHYYVNFFFINVQSV